MMFRVPGSMGTIGLALEVADDTGSDSLCIFEDDLHNIVSFSGVSTAPFIASTITQTVGGMVNVIEVALDVAYVQDSTGRRVTEWGTWPVSILAGSGLGRIRLGGPFLRSLFYVGSAPALPQTLYNASSAGALTSAMPNRTQCDTTPRLGAAWRIGTNADLIGYGPSTHGILHLVTGAHDMPMELTPALPGAGPQPGSS